MGKKGNEEGVHWIVKVATGYLWVMFLGYLAYSITSFITMYIRFGIGLKAGFELILSLIIFLPLFFLTFMVFKSTQNKIILFLARLSPLIPVAMVILKNEFGHIFSAFFLSGYIYTIILKSQILGFIFHIISVISATILIINAWYPIRSKSKEVKS